MSAPNLSIVIPVYNEEGILHSSVVDLVTSLDELGWDYELLLAENGSSDRTVALGEELSQKYPRVSIHSLGEPNYGKALREGIRRARGKFVICDEIDLCDTEFYRRARQILDSDRADMVVGSKVMQGAEDRRPMMRHAATLDIRQQCTGFLYGLSIADAYIRAELYDYVLVVASEVQSTGLDLSDRGRDISVVFDPGTPKERTLLHIPAWDFHWQDVYYLVHPLRIGPGDTIRVSCTFDNSRSAQPVVGGRQLAPRYVLWGEGTTDEMCLGMLSVAAG